MIDYDKQEQLLNALNITVLLLDDIDGGVTLIYNNKRYIATNKNYDKEKKYWVIEHELSHNLLNNLYDLNENPGIITTIEKETNEDTMFRHKLVKWYLICESLNIDKDTFIKSFKITEDLYDVTERYVMFKRMEGILHAKHN